MGNDQSRDQALLSHNIIDPSLIRKGDHIYRRLSGLAIKRVADHHGVVCEAPTPYTSDNAIRVIEMTADGLRKSSLPEFLDGHYCRLVHYNTHEFYEAVHRKGSCHVEPSAPWSEIQKRIKEVELMIEDEKAYVCKKTAYSLIGTNCEELAVWIKTGLYKGAAVSQLTEAVTWAKGLVSAGGGAGVGGAVSEIIAQGIKSGLAKQLGVEAAEEAIKLSVSSGAGRDGLKKLASQIGVDLAKNTAKGIGIGVGIGVGIEVLISVYKIHKYRTDRTGQVLRCDLMRDLKRSWLTTALATGVGAACVAAGVAAWPALLAGAGAALLATFAMSKAKLFDGKSHKEKRYAEYKLTKESTVKDLKRVRRKIRYAIREEMLHPDMWSKDEKFKDKDSTRRLEKYMWLTAMIELLSDDIARGYVCFTEEKEKQTLAIDV